VVAFADGPVHASVPATSANLGPGFDSLGLALALRDDLSAEVLGAGLEIEVAGAGADEVPRDETHLVVRAMREAFRVMGAEPPGLRLRCDNRIPHARGLGSSSAAIVGGISLARGLVAGGRLLLDDDAVFRLAARIEGHPDNVAPAFYGGFVISGSEDGECYAVPAPVDPRVSTVVFVPAEGVSTERARGLLPSQVPHADAAADAGRAALLVAALGGKPEHLLRATRDYLHQEYRRPAMPDSLALVDALRTEGVPALVSGAGPTVLAFTGAGLTRDELLDRRPTDWIALPLEVDHEGVRLG
jgi:homoserine kinase